MVLSTLASGTPHTGRSTTICTLPGGAVVCCLLFRFQSQHIVMTPS